MSSESLLLPHDWYTRPLPANVFFGERCWCYSAFAFAHYHSRRAIGVRVGHDTGIYNGTFFDLGPGGQVEIGDYCTLVGVIIRTDRRIVIGSYAFIAHEVVIADDAFAAPLTPNAAEMESRDDDVAIRLDENCWIGARAVLLRGARIGQGAIVGAAAVVDFEVPPFAIVAGNPARIVGSANR